MKMNLVWNGLRLLGWGGLWFLLSALPMQSQELSFSDAFDQTASISGGILGGNYNIYGSGDISIGNHKATSNTAFTETAAIYTGIALSNPFSIQASFQVPSTLGWTGIIFNWVDAKNYYQVRYKIVSATSTSWQFIRVIAGQTTLIASGYTTAPLSPNVTYTLHVSTTETPGIYSFTLTDLSGAVTYANSNGLTDSTLPVAGYVGFDFYTPAGAFASDFSMSVRRDKKLILSYDFNKISGSTIPDASGNGRAGSLFGGATQGAAGSGLSVQSADRSLQNTFAVMAGAGGGISCATALGNLGSFTVTFWFKADGAQAVKPGTHFLHSGSDYLGIDAGNNLIYSYGGSTVIQGYSNLLQGEDNWIFVAMTYNGALKANQFKLYIGDLTHRATLIAQSSIAPNSMTVGALCFGADVGGNHALDGWLDDIQVYGQASGSDSELTLAELLDIQSQRSSGIASGDFMNDPLSRGSGLVIDSVWSGCSVPYSLLTLQNIQIAAYYNQDRKMTVAARNLNSTYWYRQVINSTAGWDNHNYLTLAVDPDGYLHLSGNMHCQAMNYYRSASPVTDAGQFVGTFMQKVPVLANGSNENRATYPTFLCGPNGEFIFSYRNHTGTDSASWAGTWQLLEYDLASKTYFPTPSATPIFKWNTDHYSVYPSFSVNGRYIHCVYMWRGNLNSNSNYNLSYIRSADRVNWMDAFGNPVSLPITPSVTATAVDQVPQLGGLLNGQPQISFDRDGLPMISYHKYDGSGKSQVYLAKPINGSWKKVQLTANTTWTWNFSGYGSLSPGGAVSNFFGGDDPIDGLSSVIVTMKQPDGTILPESGYKLFDEAILNGVLVTLPNTTNYDSYNAPVGNTASTDTSVVENTYTCSGAAMVVNRLSSRGIPVAEKHYFLRWETMPGHNDQPWYDDAGNVAAPTPSKLKLFRTYCEFDSPVYSGNTIQAVMLKPAQAVVAGSMMRTQDNQRAFGSYLSSSASGLSSYAEWNFQVNLDADYALGGSVCGADAGTNSFYVQLDNDPLIEWHFVEGKWGYFPVTSGTSKGLTRLSLAPGTHRLRVYAREPGARLEYLWLNMASVQKVSSQTPITYQGFSLSADVGCVSGYALSSPVGSNPGAFTAHYEIPVWSSGNYLLLGRTKARDDTTDSFKLSINGSAQQNWFLPINGTLWSWKAIGTGMSLNAGVLSLDVAGREGGSALDSFILLKVP